MSEGLESPRGGSGEQSTTAQVQEKVQQTAQQAAGQAREKAGDVKERARATVDQRSTQAGEQARSVAQAMRKTSEELRSQGQETPARANERAADFIERFAGYLEQADADRLLRDLESFGRRRPWTIALAGAAVGLLGSRLLKASAPSERTHGSGGSATTAPPRAGSESVGVADMPSGGAVARR